MLRIRFVLSKQHFRRAVAVNGIVAQVGMRRVNLVLGDLGYNRLGVVLKGPRVAEPERRQYVKLACLRPSILGRKSESAGPPDRPWHIPRRRQNSDPH